MVGQALKQLLKILRKKDKSYSSGFTLLEVLISLIIASIVVSGLLYLVVELLRIDQRESVLENTQRDMQRALDYVSDDLREALYVYSTPETFVTNQLTADGDDRGIPGGGAVPVLAFWRIDPLSSDDFGSLPDPCSNLSDPTAESNCDALKLRQAHYTLVVYFSEPDTDTNDIWSGKARITRYTLPEYKTSALASTTQTDAFVDNSPGSNLAGWTPLAGSTEDGDVNVLVDYLAALDFADDAPPTCEADYQISPATATSNSFLACIRPAGGGTGGSGLNQDVIVYLRGDATGENDRGIGLVSDVSRLPTLQTTVLVRGVVDKNPE